MKISTSLIILILIWILSQHVRGVAYTTNETYVFLAVCGVMLYCIEKLKDRNRKKKEALAKMNWHSTARLNVRDLEEVPELPAWIAEDMPFQRRTTRVGGIVLHYIDDGPKDNSVPTILFVHGDPGWCYSWRLVIKELKKKYSCRCIAVDLVGFGLSEKPEFMEHIGLRIDNQMRMISTLIAHLDPSHLIVVGYGWGGVIASGVARQHTQRLFGVVLSNTSIRRLREKKPRFLAIARLANIPYIGAFAFRWMNITVRMMHHGFKNKEKLTEKIKSGYQYGQKGGWIKRCGPLSISRAMPAPVGIFPADFHHGNLILKFCEDWASRISMPVELVWGTADPFVGKSLTRTEDAFVAPGARVFVTKLDVGHFVHEEAPTEITAAITRNIERLKQYDASVVKLFHEQDLGYDQ